MQAYFGPASGSSGTAVNSYETKQEKASISDDSFLPKGFAPGEHDIVIGRSMKYYNHSGNKNLRNMVAVKLDEYSNADKSEKSFIITEVMEQIKQISSYGGFLKLDPASGRWYKVGEYLSREKVSQTFRDALGSYRSSSNCKKERRKLERARAYAEAEMRNAKRPKLNKDSPLASFSLPQQMQPLPALPSLAVKTNPDPAVPTESRMLDVLATILPSDYEQDPNPLEPNQIMDSNSISQDPTLQQQTQQQLHYSYDADIFEPASIYEPSAYDAFHPSPVPSNVDWSRFLCNAKSIDDSGGNHEGRRRNGFLGIKQPSQPNIRYATSA